MNKGLTDKEINMAFMSVKKCLTSLKLKPCWDTVDWQWYLVLAIEITMTSKGKNSLIMYMAHNLSLLDSGNLDWGKLPLEPLGHQDATAAAWLSAQRPRQGCPSCHTYCPWPLPKVSAPLVISFLCAVLYVIPLVPSALHLPKPFLLGFWKIGSWSTKSPPLLPFLLQSPGCPLGPGR